MKRQRFYRFTSFAQNADIQMSGKRRNSTIDQKCIPDCHHIPAALCVQHRDQRISPIVSEKLGTLSDPVTTRSDKHTENDADRS